MLHLGWTAGAVPLEASRRRQANRGSVWKSRFYEYCSEHGPWFEGLSVCLKKLFFLLGYLFQYAYR